MRDKYMVFLRTAEEGNITRAAEKLNYTQSGISHVIADLEAEMGFPLFVRGRNGVTLTEQGQIILEEVRKLVARQEQLERKIVSLRENITGTVKIGIVTSASVHLMPRLIREFRQDYPQIKLDFQFSSYGGIAEWIRSGAVDCGFMTESCPFPMDFVPIRKDPMVAVLPSGHPLAVRAAVCMDQLLGETFVLQPANTDYDIDAVVEPYRDRIHIARRLSDDLAIFSMVAAGLCVSVMSERIASVVDYDLTIRPLEPTVCSTLGLACRNRDLLSPAAKIFMDRGVEILREV